MCFNGTNFNNRDECRMAVEMNDRFIRRCADLWERFAHLPACDDLIYNAVKNEFPGNYLSGMDNYCYLPPPGDPGSNRGGEDFSGDMPGEGQDAPPPDENGMPGDISRMPPEMQEVQRALMSGRMLSNAIYQLLFDWVNIYAAVVQGEQRREGLQILTILALIQANLRSAMDNLAFEQPQMAVVLVEKVVKLMHDIRALMGDTLKKNAALRQVFQARYDSMAQLETGFASLLDRCRKIGENHSPF